MKISKYFTIDELTYSNTAYRLQIPNFPNQKEKNNLILLSNELLDPIREYLKRPLYLTCAYRNERINKLVDGVINSVHTLGLAADIIIREDEQYKFMSWLSKSDLSYDQAIAYPKRNFIHIGLNPKNKNRFQLLKSLKKGSYEKYII